MYTPGATRLYGLPDALDKVLHKKHFAADLPCWAIDRAEA